MKLQFQEKIGIFIMPATKRVSSTGRVVTLNINKNELTKSKLKNISRELFPSHNGPKREESKKLMEWLQKELELEKEKFFSQYVLVNPAETFELTS